MQAIEFLHASKQLLTSSGEANYRSSISRAYYAAFHEIKQIIGSNVPQATLRMHNAWPKMTHKFARTALKNASNSMIADLGDSLNDLQTDRVNADCILHKEATTREKAQEFIEDVEDFLNEVKGISPQEIGEEVLSYIKRTTGSR